MKILKEEARENSFSVYFKHKKAIFYAILRKPNDCDGDCRYAGCMIFKASKNDYNWYTIHASPLLYHNTDIPVKHSKLIKCIKKFTRKRKECKHHENFEVGISLLKRHKR